MVVFRGRLSLGADAKLEVDIDGDGPAITGAEVQRRRDADQR